MNDKGGGAGATSGTGAGTGGAGGAGGAGGTKAMPPKNKRSQKAAETRRRILEAAGELFVGQGYGATTLQEIAARAGVAVQTLYFVFGNKRTILKELVDVTIAGDDEPVATMDRPWFRAGIDAPGAEEHLRLHVAGTRAVLDRVAPVTQVVATAAATDTEVCMIWPEG